MTAERPDPITADEFRRQIESIPHFEEPIDLFPWQQEYLKRILARERRSQVLETDRPLRHIKRDTRGPGHPRRSKKRKNR